MTANRLSLSLCLLPALSLLPGTPALAQSWSTGRYDTQIDVSLIWQRYETDLDISGEDARLRINKLGVAIIENSYPGFRPALYLGWVTTTPQDNPALGSLKPVGGYIGVGIESYLLDTNRFRLGLSGDYTYHSTTDDESDSDTGDTTASADLNWSEATLGGWAELKLNRVHLLGGVNGYWLDGDQSVDEPPEVRGNTSFKQADTLDAYAGARIIFPTSGHVDFLVHQQAREGVELRFTGHF